MGIINCTPDSFHSDSRAQNTDLALALAEKHLNEGAVILDIGAYSSRPGAENISTEEEKNRLLPVLKAIREKYPEVLISIDSFRADIIEATLPFGIDFVNDISFGEDPRIFKLIEGKNIAYILMHSNGTPEKAPKQSSYKNISAEVFQSFQSKINSLKEYNIKDVIVDPGFGFAKTLEENFQLFKNTNLLTQLNAPILIGISRKSMIYKTLNCTPAEALNGTSALHAIALQNGGNILRVHDVKEAMEVIKLHSMFKN